VDKVEMHLGVWRLPHSVDQVWVIVAQEVDCGETAAAVRAPGAKAYYGVVAGVDTVGAPHVLGWGTNQVGLRTVVAVGVAVAVVVGLMFPDEQDERRNFWA
jgi:hypothetical protein